MIKLLYKGDKKLFEHGMDIIRADFHLHTKQDKEFKYDGLDYVNDYINELVKHEIRVGVITNHNKFDLDEYKALKKAAKKKDIFLLPGVELSIKQGANAVHSLIVFNPDEWLKNSENHISKIVDAFFLGISNAENENTSTNEDLLTCIQKLNSMAKDYFIIFAHVEQKSGFLKECKGGLIESLAQKKEFRERVIGFQKIRTRDLQKNAKDWMGYEVANVEGSDPKTIEEIGKGTQCTYIKIGEYSFNSIKYALKDFKNRIFTEQKIISHGYINSMKCLGGKLDGQEFFPSAALNTFIGIRGSGKSSVLEVMRYALDLEPATDIEYKNSLVKSVLGSGGQVLLSVVDRHGKQYQIKRILNEAVSIVDENNMTLPIGVGAVLNNPLYFGQKDLALTRAGYELELLNRLVGKEVSDFSENLTTITNELSENIKKLLSVSSIPDRIAEITDKNAEIEHKLKIYKEKGIDSKLKKQTSCNDDLVKIDTIYQKTKNIIESLENAYSDGDVQGISLSDYQSEFNQDIFQEAKILTDKSIEFLGSLKDLVRQLNANLGALNEVKQRLLARIESLKEEFAQIKREINDDTIDLDSFVSYQKMYTSNEREIESLKEVLKDKAKIEAKVKKLIDSRNDMLNKSYQSYAAEIRHINESQSELKISIEFKGNKDIFRNDLQKAFKGTGISEIKYKEISEQFSDFVSILEDYFLGGGKKIKGMLTDNIWGKVSDKIEHNFAEYVKLFCPDSIKISYHGKLLSRHSIGQRASALILFILTQQDSDVIIIDQPEDDLDNQVIYKELIQTIKQKKADMQFIFATHNANIPVLGDAEKIITTIYDGDTGKIDMNQGTIDSSSSHKAIVDIMEGGEEAFNRRNEIYTSW